MEAGGVGGRSGGISCVAAAGGWKQVVVAEGAVAGVFGFPATFSLRLTGHRLGTLGSLYRPLSGTGSSAGVMKCSLVMRKALNCREG